MLSNVKYLSPFTTAQDGMIDAENPDKCPNITCANGEKGSKTCIRATTNFNTNVI
mgnify:CR=1 FL=1